jgi:hypothetical protein
LRCFCGQTAGEGQKPSNLPKIDKPIRKNAEFLALSRIRAAGEAKNPMEPVKAPPDRKGKHENRFANTPAALYTLFLGGSPFIYH